jgi:hypothetical protein
VKLSFISSSPLLATALALTLVGGACTDSAGPGASLPPPTSTATAPATAPATASAPEADPAAAEPPADPACGLRLDQVALYQGVEVVLGRGGAAVAERNAEVVAGRPALVRAFVTPPAGVSGLDVSARLRIESAAGPSSYDARRTISAPSAQAELGSTLNFDVPGAALTPDAALSVEVTVPDACQGIAARFPASGNLPLAPIQTGTLKVKLVPLRYDTDGSRRLPDTSPEQLERFRSQVQAVFPVVGVELEVRPEAGTSVTVSADKGWPELLEAMRDLRARDGAPADVYYYGLIAPAPSPASYCAGACIGGLSYIAGAGNPGVRVGVGIGYAGLMAADALAHELGHMHGRAHSPCGGVAKADSGYPYPNADTGGWGFDARGGGRLQAPTSKDLMSYCAPRWISDYTFRALATRSHQVNVAPASIPQALHMAGNTRWRVLLIDAAGRPRWGLDAQGDPPGNPVTAQGLDDAGAVTGPIEVWQAPLGDGDEKVYWVPRPEGSGGAIQIPGAAPLPFGASTAVSPLGR